MLYQRYRGSESYHHRHPARMKDTASLSAVLFAADSREWRAPRLLRQEDLSGQLHFFPIALASDQVELRMIVVPPQPIQLTLGRRLVSACGGSKTLVSSPELHAAGVRCKKRPRMPRVCSLDSASAEEVFPQNLGVLAALTERSLPVRVFPSRGVYGAP